MKDFYTAIKDRRSHYGLSKEVKVSDQRIKEVIEHSVVHTPTAFNSQSGRVVVLLKKDHDKLWELTESVLKKIVPETQFQATKDKMDAFKAAYGTVLFFEDQEIVTGLQEQFPLYKDNFPVWSNQASGMLQYNVWTSLEVEGLGASLQHYNELIEELVKKEWAIDSKWTLMSQMPFGNPVGELSAKEIKPVEDRLLTFGA